LIRADRNSFQLESRLLSPLSHLAADLKETRKRYFKEVQPSVCSS
uniref:Uncharacterized protein n=1 Tax=Parascaris equorum TaxID=6256 RepID=A0A914RH18_PAREQ